VTQTAGYKRVSMAKTHALVGYQPHDVQREIHAARREARFRLVCAGRRTGKSTLGGHELTVKAVQARYRKGLSRTGRRSEHWIVGPEYSDAEKEFRVLFDDIKRLGIPMDHPGTYNDPIGGNMHLSLYDGGFQVHAKSAKYPDTLVGEALESVILAEAAKLKPAIWTKYIRPMLSDYAHQGYGDALMTSTPEGKNWFYDYYMRGQNPADAEVYSIRMPSWSNNILFPGGRYDSEIRSMEADLTEEKFKQEIGADFTDFVGRVFKRFSEDDNVGDYKYNPELPLYIAEDAGFRNPSVALFLQVDVWDNVYVIDEYYERERTPTEFANDVFDHPRLGPLARKATLLYADPADPGTTRTLEQTWRVRSQSGTGGLLKDRLDLIRKWLTPTPLELPDDHPDKKPKLFFDRSLKHTIKDMNDYRYPETKKEAEVNENESPRKVDDHAPEALGRFFGGYYGPKQKEQYAIQSKAVMRPRR
jgi:hypothetical protein